MRVYGHDHENRTIDLLLSDFTLMEIIPSRLRLILTYHLLIHLAWEFPTHIIDTFTVSSIT
jgi:hypothetical protein